MSLEKFEQTREYVSEVRATLYVPAFTLEGFPLLLIPLDRRYKDILVLSLVMPQHHPEHTSSLEADASTTSLKKKIDHTWSQNAHLAQSYNQYVDVEFGIV